MELTLSIFALLFHFFNDLSPVFIIVTITLRLCIVFDISCSQKESCLLLRAVSKEGLERVELLIRVVYIRGVLGRNISKCQCVLFRVQLLIEF